MCSALIGSTTSVLKWQSDLVGSEYHCGTWEIQLIAIFLQLSGSFEKIKMVSIDSAKMYRVADESTTSDLDSRNCSSWISRGDSFLALASTKFTVRILDKRTSFVCRRWIDGIVAQSVTLHQSLMWLN